MTKVELLKKAKKMGYDPEDYPLFKGIFIIQERKLHDSGYRLLNIIGHTQYNPHKKDFEYYLISNCSDVIDFKPTFEKLVKGNYDMCQLHLDINSSGIIHIWTNSEKCLKVEYPFMSSCSFEVVEEE